jgi:hypothetical protein
MPAAAACSLQRLDDNLAQHVISCACLDTCKALSLTCRRFCHLVGTAAAMQAAGANHSPQLPPPAGAELPQRPVVFPR